MKYQEFTKAINQKQFTPCYLFTGPEQYIGNILTKNLKTAAVPEDVALLNLNEFSDKETEPGEILAACRQVPFLSPYRVITVNESCGLLSRSDEETLAQMKSYLSKPCPTTILIIKDSKPDKRKKLSKLVMEQTTVVDFQRLTEGELITWIGARLKKGGKQTTKQVISRMITDLMYLENESISMETIDHELQKLMDFVGIRDRITMEDLDVVLPKSIDENVFRMVEHFLAGRAGEGLSMYRHFLLEGEQPIGLFALVISQIRTLLQAQMLNRQQNSVPSIAAQIKRPPFVVKKLLSTAKSFRNGQLETILCDAADLDQKMKTGVVDPAPALEVFLLRLKY